MLDGDLGRLGISDSISRYRCRWSGQAGFCDRFFFSVSRVRMTLSLNGILAVDLVARWASFPAVFRNLHRNRLSLVLLSTFLYLDLYVSERARARLPRQLSWLDGLLLLQLLASGGTLALLNSTRCGRSPRGCSSGRRLLPRLSFPSGGRHRHAQFLLLGQLLLAAAVPPHGGPAAAQLLGFFW